MKELKPKLKLISVESIIFLLIVAYLAISNFSNVIDILPLPSFDAAAISEAQDEYADLFKEKDTFIEVRGLTAKVLGQRELNERIMLSNGYLIYTQGLINNYDALMQSIGVMKSYLDVQGIPLLFVAPPPKFDGDKSLLPPGKINETNGNIDLFVASLRELGVTALNLKQIKDDQGISNYDIFYRTDHHWTISGAFWAYQQIMRFMADTYGDAVDAVAVDKASYTSTVYEDYFLGSDGKRTGYLYAGADDLELLTPNFETKLEMWRLYDKAYFAGDFEQVLINNSKLRKDYMHANPYAAFVTASPSLLTIRNESAVNQEKLLLFGDSYSRPVLGFMATQYREISLLDMRQYKDTSALQFIRFYKPDRVMFLYNPSVWSANNPLFDFGTQERKHGNYLNLAYPHTLEIPQSASAELSCFDTYLQYAQGETSRFSAVLQDAEGSTADAGALSLRVVADGQAETVPLLAKGSDENGTTVYADFTLPEAVSSLQLHVVNDAPAKEAIMRFAKLEIVPVIAIENLHIEKKDNRNNYYRSTETLKPGGTYTIGLNGVHCSNDEVVNQTVRVYDNSAKKSLRTIQFFAQSNFPESRTFTVPEDAIEPVLLVYAGRSGQTENNELTLERLYVNPGTVSSVWSD